MGIEEVPKGTGFDQFDHMMGSGSPATRARRLELAGKHACRICTRLGTVAGPCLSVDDTHMAAQVCSAHAASSAAVVHHDAILTTDTFVNTR